MKVVLPEPLFEKDGVEFVIKVRLIARRRVRFAKKEVLDSFWVVCRPLDPLAAVLLWSVSGLQATPVERPQFGALRDETMWLGRAHSVGHARQHVNLIGFAISVNSIAVHEHRRRCDTAIAA